MKSSSTEPKPPKHMLLAGIKAHAPILIFAGLYCLAALAFTSLTLKDIGLSILSYFFLFFCFVLTIFMAKAIWLFFEMIFVIKPQRPLKYWLNDIKAYFFAKGRSGYALPILACFFLLMTSFSAFKTEITAINPFSYDQQLSKIDFLIHFNHYPWQLVHNALSHPAWAIMLDSNYSLWFFLIIYSFFIVSYADKTYYEIAIRYVIASLLLWSFGGNFLATIFSSAGPCYYDAIVGKASPYTNLMSYLHAINELTPIKAVQVQQILWDSYQAKDGELIKGISAFPSMHVASSALLACAAFAYRTLTGWIIGTFAFLILVGSVYLGWHYAVDSYAGILLALLAWFASKPISKWYIKRAAFTPPIKLGKPITLTKD